jgi:hypothetical protein
VALTLTTSKLVVSSRLGLRGIISKSKNFLLAVCGLRIQNLCGKARNRDSLIIYSLWRTRGGPRIMSLDNLKLT